MLFNRDCIKKGLLIFVVLALLTSSFYVILHSTTVVNLPIDNYLYETAEEYCILMRYLPKDMSELYDSRETLVELLDNWLKSDRLYTNEYHPSLKLYYIAFIDMDNSTTSKSILDKICIIKHK